MFQRASLLVLCHQIPRKVMNEPLCTVSTALADPGGVAKPFEQGELTPLAECNLRHATDNTYHGFISLVACGLLIDVHPEWYWSMGRSLALSSEMVKIWLITS